MNQNVRVALDTHNELRPKPIANDAQPALAMLILVPERQAVKQS